VTRAAALAALLFLPALAAGQGLSSLTEMEREIRLEEKGGLFTKRVRDVVSNAKVKTFTVVCDWWNGGVDERVGNEAKATKGEYVLEVRRGKRWHELPAVKRDLRLEARVKAPEGLFKDEPVRGDWIVRMKKGDEPVRKVAIRLVYIVPWGKGLAQPDLAVERIVFDDLETHPPAENRFPEKRDFPTLEAGKTYKARVHLENRGYGDVNKPDVALFLTRPDGKGRKGLPPLSIEIYIREKESLRSAWKLPVPKKLKPGLYLLHAVADPRQRVSELDEENNAYSRPIRVK
jgi:hypothetical protein